MGAANSATYDTAANCAHTKSASYDGSKHSAELIDVNKAYDYSAHHIYDSHKRNELLCDRSDSLKTSHNNKTCKDHKKDTSHDTGNTEGSIHIYSDRIDLTHVAYTK